MVQQKVKNGLENHWENARVTYVAYVVPKIQSALSPEGWRSKR